MDEDDETLKQIEAMRQELEYLRGRVNALETQERLQPTAGLPNTWLLSHNLLKRAFAVYGHYLLAAILIAIPLLCIYIFLIMVFGFASYGLQ